MCQCVIYGLYEADSNILRRMQLIETTEEKLILFFIPVIKLSKLVYMFCVIDSAI